VCPRSGAALSNTALQRTGLLPAAERDNVSQTAMIELSPAARERIHALFREEDLADAQRMLTQCTDNALLISDLMRQGVDRIVFAMIRLSGGSLDRLENEAIPLFRRDWRDLLVAADFADDVHAHETWQPRRFDSKVDDEWMAGRLPDGVEFGLGHAIEVLSGLPRGQTGAVIALLGLEPEPRYLVELGSGKESEELQRMLKGAG
jgi:hypothetical protein